VKRNAAALQSKWELKFVTAQQELDIREKQLKEQEEDQTLLSAELQVREQLLEQNIRRSESISLSERERRLRLLQGIEAELCVRERQLRRSEAAYLGQLVEPELVRLRTENQKLRETIDELRSARDGANVFFASPTQRGGRGGTQQQSRGAGGGGLERGLMSPSFKLL
jgi:hypothetical protein